MACQQLGDFQQVRRTEMLGNQRATYGAIRRMAPAIMNQAAASGVSSLARSLHSPAIM